jgi:CRISPR-associated protein Csx3
MSDIEL